MLEIQSYLKEGGTLGDLKNDLGLIIYLHPDHPLVGFKYHMLDSPKTHPIVRECRGLVLELDSWNIVAKPFPRFYNVGEVEEEWRWFNWSDFHATDKEDGSLAIVYFYNGQWHMNTSGSFGLGPVHHFNFNWQQLFWDTLKTNYGITTKHFDRLGLRDTTLIFELCTPYNKIVRKYSSSKIFLLSAFKVHDPVSFRELPIEETLGLSKCLSIPVPTINHFSSKVDITNFLLTKEEEDPSYEGLVLRDSNNLRYKWKTKTYVALHHMKDNGNILHPKNLIPIVLANEIDEILSVFPECKTALLTIKEELDQELKDLLNLWNEAKSELTSKDFAIKVKHHRFSSLLFKTRSYKGDASLIKKLWRQSSDLILKLMYNKRTFTFDV